MLTNKRQNQNRVNKIILAFKQARINRGITRYQLSKDTGLSDSSISNIEQLKQNPTLSTLMEMAVSINFDLPKALKENYPDLPEDAENASGNAGGARGQRPPALPCGEPSDPQGAPPRRRAGSDAAQQHAQGRAAPPGGAARPAPAAPGPVHAQRRAEERDARVP